MHSEDPIRRLVYAIPPPPNPLKRIISHASIFKSSLTTASILQQYARVSADEPDLEADAHQHHHHDAARRSSLELNETRTNANGDHVHCESCDRQLERRERQRSRDQCCATVSRTMMTMSLFLMIFGIVAVLSWRRVSR